MPRGRQPNLPRRHARDAGHKTYADPDNPCLICGGTARYVVNAQCVECVIARGKARYAALDFDALAALKAKDRERYLARLRAGRAPE